eukprot:4005656-Amphidinium_carterae.1
MLRSKGRGVVTMYDLCKTFVVPWTRGTGCSLAVLMTHDAQPEEREPQLMISHAWAEDVEECQSALQTWANDKEMPSSTNPGDDGPTIEEQLKHDPFKEVTQSSSIREAHGGFGMCAFHTSEVDLYGRL